MAGLDLSFLSPAQTLASTLTDLVLVTPHKDNNYRPQQDDKYGDSIIFHYEKENNMSLASDITDHYIEDNTSIQDQIILKPETIKVRGVIGELYDNTPPDFQPAKYIIEKLAVLGSYLPELTATATAAYNQAEQVYNQASSAYDAALSAWSNVNSDAAAEPVQTQQQSYFNLFYGYWKTRTLFSVQTPWAVFDNMAIETLELSQESETNTISEFEINFKKMRFISTSSSTGTADLLSSGRSSDQISKEKYFGFQTPEKSSLPNYIEQIKKYKSDFF